MDKKIRIIFVYNSRNRRKLLLLFVDRIEYRTVAWLQVSRTIYTDKFEFLLNN